MEHDYPYHGINYPAELVFIEYNRSFHIYDNEIYGEKSINHANIKINEMKKLLAYSKITIHDVVYVETVPLIYAIENFMHPNIVQYLKDAYYNEECMKIMTWDKYVKMPHIYNKETGEVNTLNMVADVLKWMYFYASYEILPNYIKNTLSKEIQFALLDEYAKIFGVTYVKKLIGYGG